MTGHAAVTPHGALPQELHPDSLRLAWAAGDLSGVRVLVGSARAPDARRLVLELLESDPRLVPTRRSAFGVLRGVALTAGGEP